MSDDNWTRPPPRTPRAPPGPSAVVTIFYGYPAELIAEWCGISVASARLYKAGKRKPSAAVARLFMLHRERRVLGPSWQGWIIKEDSIVDPDGNETGRMQLYNYFWLVQFSRHLAGELGEATRAEFYAMLSGESQAVPPPAEVREAVAKLLLAR